VLPQNVLIKRVGFVQINDGRVIDLCEDVVPFLVVEPQDEIVLQNLPLLSLNRTNISGVLIDTCISPLGVLMCVVMEYTSGICFLS
jgi:hypothetical protein